MIQLFMLPDGTWQAECPHCGGPIAASDSQANLEAVLVALGVYDPEPVEGAAR